ncbi:MAG TPA: hypothetical protein VNN62_13910 [Methylomirabilota bacterium]|nr:hypothetical protein [Methylomirabilota bacterium]
MKTEATEHPSNEAAAQRSNLCGKRSEWRDCSVAKFILSKVEGLLTMTPQIHRGGLLVPSPWLAKVFFPSPLSLFCFCLLPFALCLILLGCQSPQETVLVGRPAGPYRLELTLSPAQPQAAQETMLTYKVTETATKQPVQDLQILHERILHTFIVSKDFRSFAHTHHEDFFPLTPQDLAVATFHYPYVFPYTGDYLIAGEFTHKDRSWVKQFTVHVGGKISGSVEQDLRREKSFGPYQASLTTSPDPPIVGHDAELVCRLTRDGAPVTNLQLYLGTEVHMASWRIDGEHFGHEHTYTPEMARMMTVMKDHTSNPDHMARMMVQMMRRPAKQAYFGPDLPVHHVFPASGVYKIYFETAPAGKALVADFMVKVVDYEEGMDTTVRSIVTPSETDGNPAS